MKRTRERQSGDMLEDLEDKYLLDPLSCASPEQVQELYKLREESPNSSVEGNIIGEQG